jgi:flagellar motor switch protein FliG
MLKHASLEDMATLLGDEDPQTISVALTHLSPARAARVLARFPSGVQVQVASYMANIDGLGADAISQTERKLATRLQSHGYSTRGRQGGVQAVARMLRHSGQPGRRNVLDALARQQPRLAESISRQLLGFEDLADLPQDRLITALAEVSPDDLAIAMRTSSERFRGHVLQIMDAPAAEAVRRRMEEIGPVRLGDIEAAQRQILEAVRDCETAERSAASSSEEGVLA